mmetsp:Transcript_23442/g.73531  ORF Transcript_23442/g.73531 Transcript_23442/m.73531 type:complete len:267 (+) Transcript_23442:860-1660(+)
MRKQRRPRRSPCLLHFIHLMHARSHDTHAHTRSLKYTHSYAGTSHGHTHGNAATGKSKAHRLVRALRLALLRVRLVGGEVLGVVLDGLREPDAALHVALPLHARPERDAVELEPGYTHDAPALGAQHPALQARVPEQPVRVSRVVVRAVHLQRDAQVLDGDVLVALVLVQDAEPDERVAHGLVPRARPLHAGLLRRPLALQQARKVIRQRKPRGPERHGRSPRRDRLQVEPRVIDGLFLARVEGRLIEDPLRLELHRDLPGWRPEP